MFYLATNAQNVRDSPKQIIEDVAPKRPIKRIGFRPSRSEALLHCRTVVACVRKNRDCWPRFSVSDIFYSALII